jgi:hypothetical protein
MKVRSLVPVLALPALLLAVPAYASLTSFATFTGNVSESTSGCGSITSGCNLTANVPVGSTVLAAYLYSSLNTPSVVPGGTLNGSVVNYSTALGVDNGFLQAYRANVTSIVQAAVGGGSAAPFTLAVTETNTGAQDGEALVVVYSNPTTVTATQTVGILDGFSASAGDTATINFSSPLNPTAPGFVADMRIGDGFSFDGSDPNNPISSSQVSHITVDGTLISAVAGHCDDATESCTDGNLITVGSDNDPFTPASPTVGQDHERYNLTPEIHVGDTSITVGTLNPSGDDNIFLETFLITGSATINQPQTPEPATLSLLGLGLLFGARKLRRR